MHRRPSALENVIQSPGEVNINVKGAFILETSQTSSETRDIRLPNHRAVVSHVAVDVRRPLARLLAAPTKGLLDWRLLSQDSLLLARTGFP